MNVYLYHGTNQRIKDPRWDVGEIGRDFGRCFYTTYDRKTASDWARKNYSDMVADDSKMEYRINKQ